MGAIREFGKICILLLKFLNWRFSHTEECRAIHKFGNIQDFIQGKYKSEEGEEEEEAQEEEKSDRNKNEDFEINDELSKEIDKQIIEIINKPINIRRQKEKKKKQKMLEEINKILDIDE